MDQLNELFSDSTSVPAPKPSAVAVSQPADSVRYRPFKMYNMDAPASFDELPPGPVPDKGHKDPQGNWKNATSKADNRLWYIDGLPVSSAKAGDVVEAVVEPVQFALISVILHESKGAGHGYSWPLKVKGGRANGYRLTGDALKKDGDRGDALYYHVARGGGEVRKAVCAAVTHFVTADDDAEDARNVEEAVDKALEADLPPMTPEQGLALTGQGWKKGQVYPRPYRAGVLEYAKRHGRSAASKAYGCCEGVIKKWQDQALEQGVEVPVAGQQGGHRWQLLTTAQLDAVRDLFSRSQGRIQPAEILAELIRTSVLQPGEGSVSLIHRQLEGLRRHFPTPALSEAALLGQCKRTVELELDEDVFRACNDMRTALRRASEPLGQIHTQQLPHCVNVRSLARLQLRLLELATIYHGHATREATTSDAITSFLEQQRERLRQLKGTGRDARTGALPDPRDILAAAPYIRHIVDTGPDSLVPKVAAAVREHARLAALPVPPPLRAQLYDSSASADALPKLMAAKTVSADCGQGAVAGRPMIVVGRDQLDPSLAWMSRRQLVVRAAGSGALVVQCIGQAEVQLQRGGGAHEELRQGQMAVLHDDTTIWLRRGLATEPRWHRLVMGRLAPEEAAVEAARAAKAEVARAAAEAAAAAAAAALVPCFPVASAAESSATLASSTSPDDPLGPLADGESREVRGSGGNTYTLKRARGAYSCTCPAWVHQRGTPYGAKGRTCKHLKALRGEDAERARLLGSNDATAKGAAGAAAAAKAAAAAAAAEAAAAAAAGAEAAAAAAEVEAEAEAVEAVRLRDEANESLRELQAMEAEATKAEKLARAKGGSQKLGVGKAQRLADLSGAIARLEDAAAAAEAEVQTAQTKVEAARAVRRARAAEELSELSLCSPLQPSPYKYGGAGAPLAQQTRGGGGGDETMQAQVRWLARGGSSGGGGGSDEALSPLSPDRSPYASHYASHCDPTPKPPPTPARRLSLSAFGQRLLQAPRMVRASSSPSADVPARDGLLARTAGRLRRASTPQKEAPTRAAIPQRLASFDDEMRA